MRKERDLSFEGEEVLDGRTLDSEELYAIYSAISELDSTELLSDSLMEIIKRRWPELLSKLSRPH